MSNIPRKVADRLAAGIKRFQAVLEAARRRDINESDTVVIINDICSEVFGFDKYFEVTSEFAIRGTYCDLAIKLDGQIQVLLEAKAAGIELKDQHVKQAIDYAANQGVEWVVLTNAVTWRIYRVIFAKPIDQELVCEFSFPSLSPKNPDDILFLYLLSKEGWAKSAIHEFYQQRQALSPYYLGAALLTEPILSCLRRELKRVSPDVRIETAQIEQVLREEVIKREILEGDKHTAATKALAKAATKALRATKKPEKEAGEEATIVNLPLPNAAESR